MKPVPHKRLNETLFSEIGLRVHHDVVRQVTVHAAQSVAEPGAQTGTTRNLAAGLDVGDCRVVVDRFGKSAVNNAKILLTTRAVCGSNSLTQTPRSLLSCLVNLYLLGHSGSPSFWFAVIPVIRWPLRTNRAAAH